MNPPSMLKCMQGRTSFEDKWVCVIISDDPMSEHGVIKLNGLVEASGTNESSKNGIPSDVGVVVGRKLSEGEKRVAEGSQVNVDINEL